jgi:hypothetical protein
MLHNRRGVATIPEGGQGGVARDRPAVMSIALTAMFGSCPWGSSSSLATEEAGEAPIYAKRHTA